MSVKNFTFLLCLCFWVTACGRQPKVRSYVETVQLPPKLPADAMPPPTGMRAGPLSVEPIPANLPPNHPTLADASPAGGPGANVMLGREGEVPPPPAAGDLLWEVPEGWRQLPASGMRLAAFAPEGADPDTLVTLIVLPSGAASLEANISRWREQVGLPAPNPLPPVPLQGKLSYVLVNLLAESAAAEMPTSTIGAIYEIPGGRSVFLKYMGKTGQLIDSKAAFLQLAASLALTEETTP